MVDLGARGVDNAIGYKLGYVGPLRAELWASLAGWV